MPSKSVRTDGMTYISPSLTTGVLPEPQTNQVVLSVIVPNPAAQVWIENQLVCRGGTQHVFVSPPLDLDRNYTYTVRTSWVENGRELLFAKTVNVHAGQTVAANFADRSGRPVASSAPLENGLLTTRSGMLVSTPIR
jgi:uncharacterized protein (TIGR03000 family)